jgi:hypothetical protein
MKRILGPVLASLALAACDGSNVAPQVTATKAGQGSVVVTDCGTFNLPINDGLPDSAARCLIEAVQAGHSARLRVTRPTDEGDPIPVSYTAGADRRVEVITDSRQDTFGTQVIVRQTCKGPIFTGRGLDFGECSEAAPVLK